MEEGGSMLIGFTGKVGVGKTTIARMLVDEKFFIKLAFDTPLKRAMVELTGMDISHFTDPVLKEEEIRGLNGLTPRILMQKFGTEFIRDMIDPDFWIWRMDKHLTQIEQHNKSRRHIVIDDVRFNNEAELVRKRGGLLIHLRREFKSRTTQTDHRSENPVSIYSTDLIIDSGMRSETYTYDTVERAIGEYHNATSRN